MPDGVDITKQDILINRLWLPWCKERLALLEKRGVRTEMGRAYVAMLHEAIVVAEKRLGN